ncbi:nucleotidyltransferase family protein [Paenibacillus silvisoli]|uniref:nucleotidyltransferase family protein n=1 Tax=Paenibacillus silvisoli TaxID=3110539 RepID=UPI002803834C|nr:NTP transferase domain-containing protein [Paenibacillus silvisoli]
MEPMEAIVLAAGYSSRANAFKMTLRLGAMSILEHTISKFEGICSRVIVVCGYRNERIYDALTEIRMRGRYELELVGVTNERFDEGMFSSVQRGCMEVETSGFFITPGDCPLVREETVRKLAETRGQAVIPSYDRRGGHPIKLAGELRSRILEAPADSNLRSILQNHDKQYVNVGDPGILLDLDTPEDVQRAVDYYNQLGKAR